MNNITHPCDLILNMKKNEFMYKYEIFEYQMHYREQSI